MHLSKLINVLQSFDAPQVQRLKEYVHSPYFKVPAASVALFDFLYPLHPNFSSRRIKSEIIGTSSTNLSTTSKQAFAGSHLLTCIGKFIAVEDCQNNETGITWHQLKGLKEMHLFEPFEKLYVKAMQELNECAEPDVETFLSKHLLTELSLNSFYSRLNRISKTDIAPIVQTLDEFYALKKLRYLCEILNRQQWFGTNYSDQQIPVLLEILSPYKNEKYPYVYLFVHVFLMLQADTYEDSEGPYRLIRRFIAGQTATILPPSVIESLEYTMGHCLRWYNKGYQEAGNEYLWWINLKIKNNLLLENGKMMPIYYRNIVSIAVLNKKNPEWIDWMIKTFSPSLPTEYRDTNLAFARGLYHYSRKSYKEAVRYLLLAEAGEEVIFNAIIRRWQFMCLYECDVSDTNTLLNHLISYEKYLSRHSEKLVPVRQVFDKFIHYAFALLKSFPGEPNEHLFTPLQHDEHFAGKLWLEEQIAKQEKKKRSHYFKIDN